MKRLKMTDDSTLRLVWEELAASDHFSRIRRVGDVAGLAQYFAIDGSGRFAFYTKSSIRPERLQQLANLTVNVFQEKDARWTRAITLLDDEFFEEFSILVTSLVTSATDKPNETLALRSQGEAFDQWVDFYKKRQGFSLSAARGLYGEITVLESLKLLRGLSWIEALEAWKGPFGNPQDFVFGQKMAVEVKTVNTSARRVKISGSEQLSFDGQLTLSILSVRDGRDSRSGESLISAITRIQRELQRNEKELLRERLDLVGFDTDSEFSRSLYFEVIQIDNYLVESDFPRIETSSLPFGVDGIEYHLKIAALDKFKISEGKP